MCFDTTNWDRTRSQYRSGPHLFEGSAKPLFNRLYKREISESWARCPPVTPHMKRLAALPGDHTGIRQSSPMRRRVPLCVLQQSEAWSCYVYAKKKKFVHSMATPLWSCYPTQCHLCDFRPKKTHLTPGSPSVTARSILVLVWGKNKAVGIRIVE